MPAPDESTQVRFGLAVISLTVPFESLFDTTIFDARSYVAQLSISSVDLLKINELRPVTFSLNLVILVTPFSLYEILNTAVSTFAEGV
ncbi:MAG: hypothetical protein ACD_59C00011G0001 [uncultured bacterium]|nr:MAG: hypothetical protein ACD_59C00011G0001 [uncultured bacterium]